MKLATEKVADLPKKPNQKPAKYHISMRARVVYRNLKPNENCPYFISLFIIMNTNGALSIPKIMSKSCPHRIYCIRTSHIAMVLDGEKQQQNTRLTW